MIRFAWICICIACYPFLLSGQGIPPIGQWREHLPWNNAISVSHAEDQIYCATPYGLFTFEINTGTFERRSKINGLHEVRVVGMAKDPAGSRVVLAFENSNIDFVEDGIVTNLPDLLLSTINADKRIFSLFWQGSEVYLSTGLGVVVLDADRYVVKDTYRPGNNGDHVRVNGFASAGGLFYAATEFGLYAAPVTASNLSDFRVWKSVSGQALMPGPCSDVISLQGQPVVLKQDSAFILSPGGWTFLYAGGQTVTGMDSVNGKLALARQSTNKGMVDLVNPDGSLHARLETSSLSLPRQTDFADDAYWVADQNNGLVRIENDAEQRVFPNSPINTASGEMIFSGNRLWVTAGSVNENWNYTFNPNGIYRFEQDTWTGINLYVYPQIDTLLDFITVAADPETGTLFAGSFGGGLLEVGEGNQFRIYKQNSLLQPAIGDPGSYRVSGLAFDQKGDLWIANYGAPQDLLVKRKDGTWFRFTIPFLHRENALSQVLVDDLNQKWLVSPKENGLFCLDDGGTPDNFSDDRWRYFRQGRGNGNLPSPEVRCVAKDRDGFIWIGTDKGIAIITCLSELFTNSACEAILPIVRQDNFFGYLFGDESVRTIAVDGANRKWVGTRNGIWLISPDGEKVIYRFTDENSPLLSNLVNHIAIDPGSGEVFISTFNGICSFRSTATEGGTNHENVLVFPNPVPPGYDGTIAIRGLVNNAWVKITEPDGRLVFQTRALGGQAVWSGRNYKGERPSSGVYLVLSTDEANREKIVTRIFFIR
jgi:hypothetical protein